LINATGTKAVANERAILRRLKLTFKGTLAAHRMKQPGHAAPGVLSTDRIRQSIKLACSLFPLMAD